MDIIQVWCWAVRDDVSARYHRYCTLPGPILFNSLPGTPFHLPPFDHLQFVHAVKVIKNSGGKA